MASIKSKVKSAASKVKSAATSYAKNVAGGAKIVASAVSSAAKKVGGLNQSGAVLNARVGENMTAKQTLQAYKTLGMTPSTSTPSGKNLVSAPKFASGGTIPSGKNLISVPKFASSSKSGSSSRSLSNISTDGTALTSSLSRNAATSSFSPTAGTTFSSTQGNALSSVVNTPTLGTDPANQKITFPEPVAEDYSKYIPAATVPPETTEKDTALADYLKTLSREAPSTEDAYARAQKETGILERQQRVSTLTEQLNAIVNKGQAAQLSIVGQGRGIPEAIIGGQQAEIGRETAIAALPVQAQLSAAQGDLEMANQNLETLFKIYSDDAEREYSIRKEQKKMVYDIATEKEKRALEKLDKAEERAYKEKQTLLAEGKEYAKIAFTNGQSSLGAKIMALDVNSPNYLQTLSSLASGIKDPRLAFDLENKRLENQKLEKEISLIGEPSTKEKADEAKRLATVQGQVSAMNEKSDLVDSILKNNVGMSTRVGTSVLSRVGQGFWGKLGKTLLPGVSQSLDARAGLTGEGQQFSGAVHRLASQEFLDALISAKSQGATFGALTDREGDALRASATAINDWEIKDDSGKGVGIWDIDEKSFRDELNSIKRLALKSIQNSTGTVLQEDENALLETIFGEDYTIINPADYY